MNKLMISNTTQHFGMFGSVSICCCIREKLRLVLDEGQIRVLQSWQFFMSLILCTVDFVFGILYHKRKFNHKYPVDNDYFCVRIYILIMRIQYFPFNHSIYIPTT